MLRKPRNGTAWQSLPKAQSRLEGNRESPIKSGKLKLLEKNIDVARDTSVGLGQTAFTMTQDPDKSTGASTGLGACHISSSCDMGPRQAIETRIWNYGVVVEQTSRVDSGHAHFFSNPIYDSTVNIVTSGGLPKTVILRRLRWNGRVPRIMHGRSAAVFSLLAGTGCRKAENGAEPWAPGS